LEDASPKPRFLESKLYSSESAVVTGTITAIGIGVKDLSASQKFYSSALGYTGASNLSFPGWDEIIMTSKGGGPAVIPMKFKPDRPTKDLPLKLQFLCDDAKALQSRIVAAGGTPVPTEAAKAGAKEGTLFAKDIDGYLLELVPGGTGVSVSTIGFSSSNISQSATFFGRLAGTIPGEVVKTEAWDVITVSTKKKTNVQLLDFKDQRNKKKLPIKIVWAVNNIDGFKSTITNGGGALVNTSMGALANFVGMAYDPVDQILIEINSGGT
jgi:predicted enzyme related to lactoylglutathione lyase